LKRGFVADVAQRNYIGGSEKGLGRHASVPFFSIDVAKHQRARGDASGRKPFLLDAVLSVFIDEMNLWPNAEFQSG
jgi:hypothetical protein